MRAEYKTACVKFRVDNEAHMRAWDILNHAKDHGDSYADCIVKLMDASGQMRKEDKQNVTDVDVLVTEIERIAKEMEKHICEHTNQAVSGCFSSRQNKDVDAPVLKNDQHNNVDEGLMSFVLGMCDD